MENYLFIDKKESNYIYGEISEKKLEKYFEIKKAEIELGDIFKARVKKKIDSLHCYFVELENKIEGFLEFKDVIGNIKLGDMIFVEIYKINQNGKAPNVSMNFSVSSNFSVISYKNTGIKISRKLNNLDIDYKKIENLNINYGIKLRTKCENFDEEFIISDIKENYEKFKEILAEENSLPTPKLLYRKETDFTDFLYNNSDKKCIINDKNLYRLLKNNKLISNELILDENYSINYDYNVGIYVENLKKREINFENINLVIEHFEALTIVDVNSKGSFLGNSKSENSLKVNQLAIKEILRQVSFRDISGIILLDLINMNKKDKEIFGKYINTVKISDGKIWSFYGFTKTGLYEITRQRGK